MKKNVLFLQCFTVRRSVCDLKIQQSHRGEEVWGQSEITLTYVSGAGRHGSPPLSDKLVGVKTNLNDVVEQSQERSQREGCYEDGGEAKLENCREKRRLEELQRKTVLTLAHTSYIL